MPRTKTFARRSWTTALDQIQSDIAHVGELFVSWIKQWIGVQLPVMFVHVVVRHCAPDTTDNHSAIRVDRVRCGHATSRVEDE